MDNAFHLAEDSVEVKDGANVRQFLFDDFYQEVMKGTVSPDAFIRSSLTGYRWIRASQSPLYITILEEADLDLIQSSALPEENAQEDSDRMRIPWVPLFICALLFFLLLFFSGPSC